MQPHFHTVCTGLIMSAGGMFLYDADDFLHELPGYILLVNELLSPGNCFHGLRGQEAVAG